MNEPSVPDDVAFKIELPSFEGPLDLLLHLIRKHELDILDLPISFVTERYLEYLKLMQELDLDVASEYLLMAATLAHIKSRSLLPPSEDEQDDDVEEFMEDPRAELIRRLLEYQKYRQAADELGSRAVAGRDVFGRGTPAPMAEGEAPLAEVGLFKLLDAFEAILKRAKGKVALEVTAERISIQDRMTEITELLQERERCTFEELVPEEFTRYDLVVTLLALLEMTKMQVIRLYQVDPSAPLHIQFALLDAGAPTVPPPADDGADANGEGTEDEPAAELAEHTTDTAAGDDGLPVDPSRHEPDEDSREEDDFEADQADQQDLGEEDGPGAPVDGDGDDGDDGDDLEEDPEDDPEDDEDDEDDED